MKTPLPILPWSFWEYLSIWPTWLFWSMMKDYGNFIHIASLCSQLLPSNRVAILARGHVVCNILRPPSTHFHVVSTLYSSFTSPAPVLPTLLHQSFRSSWWCHFLPHYNGVSLIKTWRLLIPLHRRLQHRCWGVFQQAVLSHSFL